MTVANDNDMPERFLVTMKREDVEALERAAKRRGLSRNRYIVIAVAKAIHDEPGKCPVCEREDEHEH